MMSFPGSFACSSECLLVRSLARPIACLLDMSYMSYQFGMTYRTSITYQTDMTYRASMTYRVGMTYQAGMTYRIGRLLHAGTHTYIHMYDIIFSVMFHVKHLYSTL